MSSMVFSVFAARGSKILSGAMGGRQLLAELISAITPSDDPQIVYVDFSDIDVATSSFLRESVIAFRDYTRSALPNIYVVAANASGPVLEELTFFLSKTGDALWSCSVDDEGVAAGANLIGTLDPAEQETFQILLKLGRASAPDLAASIPEMGLSSTAWNNRLASLATKGLMIVAQQGKTKFFRPVLGTI
ncbi:MAG: hypothetical protein JWP08_4026 [Bryobacterales bacterium]|nr:hypothetical protein [Bryobacterales bacterium]